jgi:histidinol-phosphate aminotransferase
MLSRRAILRRLGSTAAGAAAVPSLLRASARAQANEASLEPVGGADVDAVLRLNRSQNAYGPSRKVMAAIEEAARECATLDSEAETDRLQQQLARIHRVAPEQVILGCGSSEIVRIAIETFAGAGRMLVAGLPTFDLVEECGGKCGAQIAPVWLTGTHSHDLDAMRARVGARSGLVYICNPNTPTGTLSGREDIEAFVRSLPRDVHVLIDEAYHHYVGASADYASFIDRPIADDRVIVSRSFSKVYGLAGMRIGYAISSPETARALLRYGSRTGVNAIAARGAAAALEDAGFVQASVARNADDRQEFFNQANARMLRVIDSQTNFVLLDADRPAGAVVEHLRTRRVIVPPPAAGFPTHIRVSLGTPAQMREFWRAMDLLPMHRMSM